MNGQSIERVHIEPGLFIASHGTVSTPISYGFALYEVHAYMYTFLIIHVRVRVTRRTYDICVYSH